MGWFDGKVAWVTGGGSGIGKATAVELARQGAKVAVSGRRLDRLREAVREIEQAGSEGLAVVCDVADEKHVEDAVDAVVERFGHLDIALANAGYSVTGRVTQLTAADWRRQLEVNVIGTALVARHALPHLKRTRGRVAMIGSVAAFVCAPKLAAYNASKHAVRALGQTLSVELHGSGVSCTVVHPGYVDSEIAQVDNAGQFDPSRPDKRPKSLMWPADKAAREVVRAIYKRKRELVFTGHGKLGAFIGQHLPDVAHWMLKRQ
jgi:NAD(P)-dependent dehydrogenase (short-subunit alcohol dehydrogenase family)